MPQRNEVTTITGFAPTSGSVGVKVTIEGRNFIGATRVSFGRVTASFEINSSGRITASVPEGANTSEIEVLAPRCANGRPAKSGSKFMVTVYALPQQTLEAFNQINYQCDNLGLWLDKYLWFEQGWKLEGVQKISLLERIYKSDSFQSHQSFEFNQNLVAAIYRRWRASALAHFHTQIFTACPEWRMVVGLGQSSILETSMTLDRITGIPVIPGSALKGLAASYAMLCYLQQIDRKEAEKNPTYKAIFGSQDEAGKVIFLDAVPTKPPELKPDIMNNHYQEYYSDTSGTVAPSPWQNPVPVYFLTLGQNSEFTFAVAARDNHPSTEALVNQAKEWLQSGLSEMGIGAKTAAGYGYMEINDS